MILLLLKEWFTKKKSLFYIGRHDVLKAPLKGKEEKEALLKLQNGDEDAKDLLIEHNLRLVVYVAKKYDSMQNGNIEDLISIGTIGLVKAVNTFNMDKNIKLATYASRCIETASQQERIDLILLSDITIHNQKLHNVYAGIISSSQYDCILNQQLMGGLL